MKKEQSEANIIAYAQQFHLPVETETLTILAEDVSLMHQLGHSDPSEGRDSDVSLIYDSLTIMAADILGALMSQDELIVKNLKQAYLTDPISKAVMSDPISKAERYQIIEGLIYWLKRDGGKALYIPETAVLKDANGIEKPMRDLLCYECHKPCL